MNGSSNVMADRPGLEVFAFKIHDLLVLVSHDSDW